ncbi:uncharacterized protein LOC134326865 [Trichomycterus rosablanca]|uniref:uncharacterized protein LOC134326865 n=1 Tax=Trichomycterus rosablanca TaxID=2290929 RepID=UPI002F35B05D
MNPVPDSAISSPALEEKEQSTLENISAMEQILTPNHAGNKPTRELSGEGPDVGLSDLRSSPGITGKSVLDLVEPELTTADPTTSVEPKDPGATSLDIDEDPAISLEHPEEPASTPSRPCEPTHPSTFSGMEGPEDQHLNPPQTDKFPKIQLCEDSFKSLKTSQKTSENPVQPNVQSKLSKWLQRNDLEPVSEEKLHERQEKYDPEPSSTDIFLDWLKKNDLKPEELISFHEPLHEASLQVPEHPAQPQLPSVLSEWLEENNLVLICEDVPPVSESSGEDGALFKWLEKTDLKPASEDVPSVPEPGGRYADNLEPSGEDALFEWLEKIDLDPASEHSLAEWLKRHDLELAGEGIVSSRLEKSHLEPSREDDGSKWLKRNDPKPNCKEDGVQCSPLYSFETTMLSGQNPQFGAVVVPQLVSTSTQTPLVGSNQGSQMAKNQNLNPQPACQFSPGPLRYLHLNAHHEPSFLMSNHLKNFPPALDPNLQPILHPKPLLPPPPPFIPHARFYPAFQHHTSPQGPQIHLHSIPTPSMFSSSCPSPLHLDLHTQQANRNYRLWQMYCRLARFFCSSSPDLEALACFLIPVVQSLTSQSLNLPFCTAVRVAVSEWKTCSNSDRMDYYHMAQTFLDFEKMELRLMGVDEESDGVQQLVSERQTKQKAGDSGADTRAQKPDEAELLKYREILKEFEAEVKEWSEKAQGADVLVNEVNLETDGGTFAQYLNELCSQEFITKQVEDEIDMAFLCSLLSDPSTTDLLMQPPAPDSTWDVPAAVAAVTSNPLAPDPPPQTCDGLQARPSQPARPLVSNFNVPDFGRPSTSVSKDEPRELRKPTYGGTLLSSPQSLLPYHLSPRIPTLSPGLQVVPLYLSDPQGFWMGSFINPVLLQHIPHGAFQASLTPQDAHLAGESSQQTQTPESQATGAKPDNLNSERVMPYQSCQSRLTEPQSTPNNSKNTDRVAQTRRRKMKPKKLFVSPTDGSETTVVDAKAKPGKKKKQSKRAVGVRETLGPTEEEAAICQILKLLSDPSYFAQDSPTSKEPQGILSPLYNNETSTENVETSSIEANVEEGADHLTNSSVSPTSLAVRSIQALMISTSPKKSPKSHSPGELPYSLWKSRSGQPCEDAKVADRAQITTRCSGTESGDFKVSSTYFQSANPSKDRTRSLHKVILKATRSQAVHVEEPSDVTKAIHKNKPNLAEETSQLVVTPKTCVFNKVPQGQSILGRESGQSHAVTGSSPQVDDPERISVPMRESCPDLVAAFVTTVVDPSKVSFHGARQRRTVLCTETQELSNSPAQKAPTVDIPQVESSTHEVLVPTEETKNPSVFTKDADDKSSDQSTVPLAKASYRQEKSWAQKLRNVPKDSREGLMSQSVKVESSGAKKHQDGSQRSDGASKQEPNNDCKVLMMDTRRTRRSLQSGPPKHANLVSAKPKKNRTNQENLKILVTSSNSSSNINVCRRITRSFKTLVGNQDVGGETTTSSSEGTKKVHFKSEGSEKTLSINTRPSRKVKGSCGPSVANVPGENVTPVKKELSSDQPGGNDGGRTLRSSSVRTGSVSLQLREITHETRNKEQRRQTRSSTLAQQLRVDQEKEETEPGRLSRYENHPKNTPEEPNVVDEKVRDAGGGVMTRSRRMKQEQLERKQKRAAQV